MNLVLLSTQRGMTALRSQVRYDICIVYSVV